MPSYKNPDWALVFYEFALYLHRLTRKAPDLSGFCSIIGKDSEVLRVAL